MHILLFSHGFGVRKDDRGLFTDIAAAFPEHKAVMFDYNEINPNTNELTVRPFSEQAKMLQEQLAEIRVHHPNATINLICHSQGCRVAAIALPEGVRKIVFLAPPTDSGYARTLARYKDNPKAVIDLEGMSLLPRSDGSFTHVPAAYWKERQNEENPTLSYNRLAEKNDLTAITAAQDTVLGVANLDNLSEKTTHIEINGDHDFTGDDRRVLVEKLKTILL